MAAPVTAMYGFQGILLTILWGAWVVLNLWIWQKAKSNGNLLMLIGSGVIALSWFLLVLESGGDSVITMQFLGVAVLTVGFYISVKPMVAAQVAALQAKVKSMTDGKPAGGASAPPPAPPSAPSSPST